MLSRSGRSVLLGSSSLKCAPVRPRAETHPTKDAVPRSHTQRTADSGHARVDVSDTRLTSLNGGQRVVTDLHVRESHRHAAETDAERVASASGSSVSAWGLWWAQGSLRRLTASSGDLNRRSLGVPNIPATRLTPDRPRHITHIASRPPPMAPTRAEAQPCCVRRHRSGRQV